MPLLNYTTSVAADRTVAEVQRLLVRAGARAVMATYDDNGDIVGLGFSIETAYGPRSFTLPVDAARVAKVLAEQRVEPRYRTPGTCAPRRVAHPQGLG